MQPVDVNIAKQLFTKRAKGRTGRKPPGEPNRTEAAYLLHLELRQRAGEVEWYSFEAVTFTLTHSRKDTKTRGQRYTPDVMVMLPDGTVEMHEIKGFQDEKNMNKLKVAAEKFPFRFMLVTRRPKKEGGQWIIKEV